MLDDKNIRESIISKIDENQIPDLSQAIKQQYLKQKSHKATPWYKKPLFYGVGTPILACGIIACIVIPNAIANHKTSGEPPIINVGKRQEEIAFGIFSINNIISNNNHLSLNIKSKINVDQFKQQIDILNPYMLTSEAMLNNDFIVIPEVFISEDLNYQYVMQINNEFGQVEFYYNETFLNSDDDEEEYAIDGIFIKDGITYQVEGEKSLENDVDEKEAELELKAYLNSSKDSYILIEQEIESEVDEYEQKYLYSIVESGVTYRYVEIGFEHEINEEKVVEIKTYNSDISNLESEYKITNDGKDFICDYKMLDSEGIINISIIDNQDGGTSYLYEEKMLGFSYILKRN